MCFMLSFYGFSVDQFATWNTWIILRDVEVSSYEDRLVELGLIWPGLVQGLQGRLSTGASGQTC